MIGFTEFSAPDKNASLTFNITNGSTNASVYLATMILAKPRTATRNPLSRFNYTVFYMKTW